MDPDARAAAAAMWDGGRYAELAARFAPAAHAVAEQAAGAPAGPVLDLAAGTGEVAVALTGYGRRVEALDLAPGLVAQGRERSRGLEVSWSVGSFDDLAHPDGSFAAVTSSFGLIFAPDPLTTLMGVRRVLAPGGRLVLSAWEAGGYVAGMSRAMAVLLPEPGRAAVEAWTRWGEADVVRPWLVAAGLREVEVERTALPWHFSSARVATDFLFSTSPGHVACLAAVGPGAAPALRRSVLEHLVGFARLTSPDDPVAIDATYLLIGATR